jgi:MFS transporter, CP family, cyanate transporter
MTMLSRANGGLSAAAGWKTLCLLWLGGMCMRVNIMAVPPVIPLIRDDLTMSETQVGILIGLPLVTWALAAVPGSLMIARFGATLTITIGLVLTGLGGASRGGAAGVGLLYLATVLMGFGIAIMQPSLPTLVREWLPRRMGLGAIVTTNGMMVAVMLGPVFTIPVVLPLVGGSWRLDLIVWALPVLATALLYFAFAPRTNNATASQRDGGRARQGWPDWRDPLIWLLGFTFGSNNALFFSINAFLPEYLVSLGRGELTAAALGWMNASQLVASTLLLISAQRLERRVWPYLVFGPAPLLGVIGIVLSGGSGAGGVWIVSAAIAVGASLAITFALMFALPAILSAPGTVHRVSAGMFTVSYGFALIVPIICGALWDITARPWAAFIPMALSAVMQGTLGTMLGLRAARHSEHAHLH